MNHWTHESFIKIMPKKCFVVSVKLFLVYLDMASGARNRFNRKSIHSGRGFRVSMEARENAHRVAIVSVRGNLARNRAEDTGIPLEDVIRMKRTCMSGFRAVNDVIQRSLRRRTDSAG